MRSSDIRIFYGNTCILNIYSSRESRFTLEWPPQVQPNPSHATLICLYAKCYMQSSHVSTTVLPIAGKDRARARAGTLSGVVLHNLARRYLARSSFSRHWHAHVIRTHLLVDSLNPPASHASVKPARGALQIHNFDSNCFSTRETGLPAPRGCN